MALLITHPDYMNCNRGGCGIEEYLMEFFDARHLVIEDYVGCGPGT